MGAIANFLNPFQARLAQPAQYYSPPTPAQPIAPAQPNPAPVAAPRTALSPLLDLIKRGESSGGNYNLLGGERAASHNLSSMSLDEVAALNKPAGAYQIIPPTMAALKKTLGLTGAEKFDQGLQDKMAAALVNQRGFDKYRTGKLSAEDFATGLAKEWASLPMISGPKTGMSFWAGVGNNKANVDTGSFKNVLGLT